MIRSTPATLCFYTMLGVMLLGVSFQVHCGPIFYPPQNFYTPQQQPHPFYTPTDPNMQTAANNGWAPINAATPPPYYYPSQVEYAPQPYYDNSAMPYGCETIDPCPCETSPTYGPWDVVFKVGFVYPFSSNVRDIYSSLFPIYQLEGSYEWCNKWGIWGNIGYLSQKGHAEVDAASCCNCTMNRSGLKNGTRMQFFQLGLGPNYTFDLDCNFSAYLGCGITYNALQIKNDSEFVKSKINKYCFGGILKSGISYYFYECFHADFFWDLSLTTFDIKNFDYSTTNFGFGLGASF